jgi:PleD family two-component response regulator
VNLSSKLSQLRILVVEDTLTQAMMIQHVLEKQEIEVTIARSGQKSLVALQTLTPDLILCDVNMPEMSGYELCKKVKADESKREIPFVLLSTLVESADLIRVIESGADNFIYKTFEGDYFIDRLKTIVLSQALQPAQADTSVDLVLFVQEKGERLTISSKRLANLLTSSFEAAVVRNRAGE